MQQLELISAFISPLEKSEISYFVSGSIASIFYGEPRLTHDIDVIVHLSKNDVQKIEAQFPLDQYYCPPEEVIQVEIRRKPYGHFNLIHHQTGLKADIYTDNDDELHAWAFKNKKRIDLGVQSLWLAPAEYVIIRKLEFYREGGSTKHIEDIKKMLPQVQDNLDINYLQNQIARRGLKDIAHKTLGIVLFN